MATIQELRQKYPQYYDMSDQEFADKFHDKYYSDMPKEEFYGKVGLTSPMSQPLQQESQSGFLQQLVKPAVSSFTNALSQPNLLSYVTGITTSQPGAASQIAQKLAESSPVQFLLGAGEGAQEIGYAPFRKKVPRLSEEGSLAAGAGRLAGEMFPAIAGGELLGIPLQAAKLAPALSRALPHLGMAGYGAAMTPEDRLTGAVAGGVGSVAAGELLPFAAKPLTSAVEKIKGILSPQKVSDTIMQTLSGGKTLEETGKSLAKKIATSYKDAKQLETELYAPIFKEVGEKSILPETGMAYSVDPVTGIAIGKAPTNYNNIPSEIRAYKDDMNLRNLHTNFFENPTFSNAHKLQSELGSSAREMRPALAKGTLSIADKNLLKGYSQARNALKDDMTEFLQRENPQLANAYESATRGYLENVVPYIENPKIAQIANEKITNPRNIVNILKNPEPETEKVIEDLGKEAKHEILYSQIGKAGKRLTGQKLLEEIGKLDKAGLSSYKTAELENLLASLSSKVKWTDFSKKGLGAILGALGAGKVVGGGLAETLGALGGAAAVPKMFSKTLPAYGTAAMTTPTTGRSLYQPISRGILATLLSGGNQ